MVCTRRCELPGRGASVPSVVGQNARSELLWWIDAVGRKQSPDGELAADLVRRSEFWRADRRLDVHREHTRSDHPSLACGAIGPGQKVA